MLIGGPTLFGNRAVAIPIASLMTPAAPQARPRVDPLEDVGTVPDCRDGAWNGGTSGRGSRFQLLRGRSEDRQLRVNAIHDGVVSV